MNRRIITICFSVMMLLITLILTGCGSRSLSGRFVNQHNPNEFLEFTSSWGNREVALISEGRFMYGTYRINGSNLTMSFSQGSFVSDSHATIIDSRTINFAGFPFILDGNPGMPWWGWGLIIFFGLMIISLLYKAITKRDLSDDLDKLNDKLDTMGDGLGEKMDEKVDKILDDFDSKLDERDRRRDEEKRNQKK